MIEDISNLIFSVFNRIYIINLPYRKDRKKEMVKSLQKIGLDINDERIVFFDAIRPTELAGFRTIGAHGCFMSHLEILKDAYNHSYGNILVFEDDLDFSSDFCNRISQTTTCLSDSDWDIYYGGYTEYDKLPDVPGEHFLDMSTKVQCTHFIGFSGKVQFKIIEFLHSLLSRPVGDPNGGPMDVDGAYSWFRKKNTGIKTCMTVPPLGYQRASMTDVTITKWYDSFWGFRLLSQFIRGLKNLYRNYKS